jgi:hypothetical protein
MSQRIWDRYQRAAERPLRPAPTESGVRTNRDKDDEYGDDNGGSEYGGFYRAKLAGGNLRFSPVL